LALPLHTNYSERFILDADATYNNTAGAGRGCANAGGSTQTPLVEAGRVIRLSSGGGRFC